MTIHLRIYFFNFNKRFKTMQIKTHFQNVKYFSADTYIIFLVLITLINYHNYFNKLCYVLVSLY